MSTALMTAGGMTTADKISVATATEDDVLVSKTFYAGSTDIKGGAMPNNGAVAATIAPGESYTIPKGYHDGTGTVSANTGMQLVYAATSDRNNGSFNNAYTNPDLYDGNGFLVAGTVRVLASVSLYATTWTCNATLKVGSTTIFTATKDGNSSDQYFAVYDTTVEVNVGDTITLSGNSWGLNGGVSGLTVYFIE